MADDAKNAKDTEKEFVGLADAATWTKWKQAQNKAVADKRVDIKPRYVDFMLA